jgi:ABC-type nitrate/sulfonate/bicarbonate transport system ATPase subunit
MTEPVVELHGVSRVFDHGRVAALTDVDLLVSEGEFVAITGRSG